VPLTGTIKGGKITATQNEITVVLEKQ
jgi:hypothetical protein